MKFINIIYNPNSGNKNFKLEIDTCVNIFQSAGYIVSIFRIDKIQNINQYFQNINPNLFDAFVISGGDGTINTVINSIMKNNLNHIPIGIIPSGTANDFASFLDLPKNTEDACQIILKNNITSVDIGLANDKYFINVCAGGLFANVGQKINKEFKKVFGKLAYYVKAIDEIHSAKPFKLEIITSKGTITDEFILFLVLNSSGTGGIEKISPTASISDGLFDFVGFRNVSFANLPSLAIKFLKGDYLEDDRVVYFTDKKIYIKKLCDEPINTDIDGEIGPGLPVKIVNINKCIKLFYDKKEI